MEIDMDASPYQVYREFERNLQRLSGLYPENRSDDLRAGAVLLTCRGVHTSAQLHRAAFQTERFMRQEQIWSEAAAPFYCGLTAIGESGSAAAGMQRAWNALKKHFLPSGHLLSAAALMAVFGETDSDFAAIAGRTKEIYKQMLGERPFSTTERQIPMCAAIALDGKEDWGERTAKSASPLRGLIASGKPARAVCQVLALSPDPVQSGQRFRRLWQGFDQRGWKLARKHQSVLAVLAGSLAPVPELLEEIAGMAELLKNPGECCPWNGAPRERLYLACLLVALRERSLPEQEHSELAWFACALTAAGWERTGCPAIFNRAIV